MKGICESCEQEKEVVAIEGYMLCEDCTEDIVICDNCQKFLGISYDMMEIDSFGKLGVPELSLPDKQTNLIFCNVNCLEEYLKKYKKELKEHDITCGC